MSFKRFTVLFGSLVLVSLAVVAQQQAIDPSASRLQQHVSYLASDALEGRRTGTAGANDAARYIAGEFARAGLRPAVRAGSHKPSATMAAYLQSFPYVAGARLSKQN